MRSSSLFSEGSKWMSGRMFDTPPIKLASKGNCHNSSQYHSEFPAVEGHKLESGRDAGFLSSSYIIKQWWSSSGNLANCLPWKYLETRASHEITLIIFRFKILCAECLYFFLISSLNYIIWLLKYSLFYRYLHITWKNTWIQGIFCSNILSWWLYHSSRLRPQKKPDSMKKVHSSQCKMVWCFLLKGHYLSWTKTFCHYLCLDNKGKQILSVVLSLSNGIPVLHPEVVLKLDYDTLCRFSGRCGVGR